VTHAFFKACLFLAAGSVIHGMHAISSDESVSQDMRRMGGLRRVMPKTARAYLLACIAITAAPIPFFAGFWSKDEILWRAFTTENTGPVPGFAIYAMGLVAAAMTSFYAWRSYFLTFEGEHATPDIATRVHESPGLMVYILTVLGALSVVSGAVLGFSPHLIGGDGHVARPHLRPRGRLIHVPRTNLRACAHGRLRLRGLLGVARGTPSLRRSARQELAGPGAEDARLRTALECLWC
jgi:NADH:ubiquinone oxidoreductase subunit 5 (subunit L)/multisubunit Na+/H+ antiporter MnhA subunit